MSRVTRPMGRKRSRDDGYILIPVVVMLTLILAAVYAATLQGSVGMESTSRAREAREAMLVAQSGLEHAIHEASSSNCTNYSLASTPFGPHSYSASFTPDSSSPVSITATATLANGMTRSVTRESAPIFEGARGVLFLQPNAANGKDTSISSNKPAANHGTDQVIESEPLGVEHTLYEFDLASLPANVKVRRATLELFVTTGYITTLEVHRVTRDWVEGSCVGVGSCAPDGATWTSTDGSTAWSTNGGDFDPLVAASADTQYSNEWLEFDVSALVSLWHSGVPNHGMLLHTTGQWVEVASSDYADETYHPKLTIEYSCECDPNPSGGTVLLQPGPGSGQDVMLRSGSPDENYGSDGDLWLDEFGTYRGLIRFDLSNLPTNAVVTDAQLEVYIDGYDIIPFGSAYVHRMTADWVEGTGGSLGLSPPDGATWNTSDGLTPWLATGGDFDPTEVDAIPVLTPTPSWYEWDVTSVVSEWNEGVHPNFGLMLKGGPGFLNRAQLVSSDDGDPSLRPKLTVNYICPCGASCSAPAAAGGDLLMVVVDPANLTPQETLKRGLIESWGFDVTTIDESDTAANYETAFAANDVVYITEDVTSSNVPIEVGAARIGVVTEEDNLSDELGLAESIVWSSGSQQDIQDDTHYITTPFGLGNQTFFTASVSLAYVSGGLSPDLLVLGKMPGGGSQPPALVALEQGSERWDELASVDSRRVQLPWGGDTFDVTLLNDDGRTLFERALEWAATTPSSPGGYLDRFAAPTCDSAIDLAGSDGSLDWTGSPWTENEEGSFCAGDGTVVLEDFSYRIELTHFATITRPVDLSGFSFGTLRFRYKTAGNVDSTHYVGVETSDDGGASWSESGRIEVPSVTSDTIMTLPITTALTADSMIRFRSNALGGTGTVWLDDVAVLDEDTSVEFVCSNYYLDSVTAKSFAGDDGTLSWSTDWLEINESDGATNGDEQAKSIDFNYVLIVKDNDGGGEGLEREADLSSTTTATLNFLYRRTNFDDADDYVSIDASSDGGANWTSLGTIGGAGSDAGYVDASYPLDAHLSVDSRIRFLGSPDLGDQDKLYIDEIEICLDADPGASP